MFFSIYYVQGNNFFGVILNIIFKSIYKKNYRTNFFYVGGGVFLTDFGPPAPKYESAKKVNRTKKLSFLVSKRMPKTPSQSVQYVQNVVQNVGHEIKC